MVSNLAAAMTEPDPSPTYRTWGPVVVWTTLACVAALFAAKAILSSGDMKHAVIGYLAVGVAVVLFGDAWQRLADRPPVVTSFKSLVGLSIFWPLTIVGLIMPRRRTSTGHAEQKEPHDA